MGGGGTAEIGTDVVFPGHDRGSEETPFCSVVGSGPSERPCLHRPGRCGVSQTRRARISAPLPGPVVRRGTQYLELELGCGPDQGCRLQKEATGAFCVQSDDEWLPEEIVISFVMPS